MTTTTKVNLVEPPAGWVGARNALPLATRPQLLLIATADGEQSTLRQVHFTGEELFSLDPDTVQFSGYDLDSGDLVSRRVPVTDFRTLACDQVETPSS